MGCGRTGVRAQSAIAFLGAEEGVHPPVWEEGNAQLQLMLAGCPVPAEGRGSLENDAEVHSPQSAHLAWVKRLTVGTRQASEPGSFHLKGSII